MMSNPSKANMSSSNDIDLSSIEDDQQSHEDQNSDFDIQEVGEDIIDEDEFKNQIKEILMTEGLHQQENSSLGEYFEEHKQQTEEDEFGGEPMKGSFMREMEILGKTLSFQSTLHDIYADNQENLNLMAQLNEQENKSCFFDENKVQSFQMKNINKHFIYLQTKYVIDFQKESKKKRERAKTRTTISNGCQGNKKVKNSKKKVLTDAGINAFSIKSLGNEFQKDETKKRCNTAKKANSSRKVQNHHKSELRKSDLSGYVGSVHKLNSSPLKKMGLSFSVTQMLKVKKSEVGSLEEKEKKKKRLENKLGFSKKK